MDKIEARNIQELIDEVNKLAKLAKKEEVEDFKKVKELFEECGLDELLED